MTERRRILGSLCVLLLGAAIVAGGGGTATVAYMSDSVTSSNSIEAADSFNSGTQDSQPCVDRNGNGVCETSEPTLSGDELVNYADSSTDVVVPAKTKVDPKNAGVSITANAVTVRGTIDVDDGIGLESTGGDLIAAGADIASKNAGVTVVTDGQLDLDDATVQAGSGAVDFAARTITAQRASFRADNDRVIVSATRNGGGQLALQDALVRTGTNDVSLESDGDVDLRGTELRAKNGQATADLSTTAATLFVDGAGVRDIDQQLVYSPSGVAVDGQPKKGSVTS